MITCVAFSTFTLMALKKLCGKSPYMTRFQYFLHDRYAETPGHNVGKFELKVGAYSDATPSIIWPRIELKGLKSKEMNGERGRQSDSGHG